MSLTPTISLHGIPNCDTVKKARQWLAGQGAEVQFHDFKKEGVPDALIDGWLQQVEWETLLNRKGNTWRGLDDATKAGVTDAASAREVMQANPSTIKRPVVRWPDGRVTVGFSEDQFAQALRPRST
ncbi:ArsC family reductase [Rhizobacter sp. OV335]|uniref:ArsC family reductase n=1 Tax=Rhizobacter sp. OV335 TaxID=1500264 RepID=UPI000917CAF1|nr:ArsC family reductase [Rhizobacter sp. OV335]SHN21263.1 transcriptional regulator, Spx/MgsR family [Rhizobacter sp. OV335]